MPQKTLRTLDELEGIPVCGGLELAEPLHPDESYPKNRWVLARCRKCGVAAHY